MKKTVIILIGIIYAASIMLVTFYGLVTEEAPTDSVPVKSIQITGDGIGVSEGEKNVVLEALYTANTPLTYQISYVLEPDNTTHKTVIYEADESFVTIDENGLVTISGYNAPGEYNVVTVTVYATDDDGNKNTAIKDVLNIWYNAE